MAFRPAVLPADRPADGRQLAGPITNPEELPIDMTVDWVRLVPVSKWEEERSDKSG
jgi:hypothetical protein